MNSTTTKPIITLLLVLLATLTACSHVAETSPVLEVSPQREEDILNLIAMYHDSLNRADVEALLNTLYFRTDDLQCSEAARHIYTWKAETSHTANRFSGFELERIEKINDYIYIAHGISNTWLVWEERYDPGPFNPYIVYVDGKLRIVIERELLPTYLFDDIDDIPHNFEYSPYVINICNIVQFDVDY